MGMISREGLLAVILVSVLWSWHVLDIHYCSALDIKRNDHLRHDHATRRGWLQSTMLISPVSVSLCLSSPLPSEAKQAPLNQPNPLDKLMEARETLGVLLANYNRATVDCTFADVPRELLETKNKEVLLEKASTFALFDKSVSVESCKTTNRIVRDYLGITGKGPLVGIDKQIKLGLEFVDVDDIDDYVTELEKFSQAYSKAASLSYTAGVADFDSVNNFSKDQADEDSRNGNSNLSQAKEAITEAKGSLDRLVSILQKAAG